MCVSVRKAGNRKAERHKAERHKAERCTAERCTAAATEIPPRPNVLICDSHTRARLAITRVLNSPLPRPDHLSAQDFGDTFPRRHPHVVSPSVAPARRA